MWFIHPMGCYITVKMNYIVLHKLHKIYGKDILNNLKHDCWKLLKYKIFWCELADCYTKGIQSKIALTLFIPIYSMKNNEKTRQVQLHVPAIFILFSLRQMW